MEDQWWLDTGITFSSKSQTAYTAKIRCQPVISILLQVSGQPLWPPTMTPPFKNAKDMYDTINTTPLGNVLWQSFTMKDLNPKPWFHDHPCLLVHEMIGNPDFKHEFEYMPYHEFSADGQHPFENFMSGDWAWKQVAQIIWIYYWLFISSRIKLLTITSTLTTEGNS